MKDAADLNVNDREELIFLLTEAAEFEHTVMCSYLYAQWSLKRNVEEGVTPGQMEAIDRWRQSILQVAMEEMLHLSLVNNLLAAIGAAPHLVRPDFPVARGQFPADVDFHLAPFNAQTLDHFVFLERPEGIDVEDGRGFVHESRYPRVTTSELLTPTPREYSSQGHLYHGIAQAIVKLAAKIGEKALFVGHGEAQLGTGEYPIPGLFPVRDVESAMRAIEEIVTQGEGAPADRSDSHYARFVAIREEFGNLRAARPDFEPAYPAAINPVLTEYARDERVNRVTQPETRILVDLGNCVYGLMVHTLAQVCAPAPLPARLRQGLADVSVELMRILTALGETCARMPLADGRADLNAGITFALPRSFGPLVQANAAQILGERMSELAGAARGLHDRIGRIAIRLEQLSVELIALHEAGEVNLQTIEKPAREPAREDDDERPQCSDQLDTRNQASTDRLTLYFDTQRCIHSRMCVLNAPDVFLANVKGPWLHPENDDPEHLAHVAMSCPSGAITYTRHDDGPEEAPPRVNYVLIRENGPYAFRATLDIEGQAPMYRATLCRCGQSRNKPFCDNSHIKAAFSASGEIPPLDSHPLPERNGPLHLKPATDGPLEISGPLEICCGTGRTVDRSQSVRLCRCGGSQNKPFCDGSHRRIGFRSDN